VETGIFNLELQANGVEIGIDHEALTFLYSESLYGLGAYSIRCMSPDWKKWNYVVRNNEALNFRLRWNMEQGDSKYYADWRRIKLDLLDLDYDVASVDVVADGACGGIELTRRCHGNIFVDKTISEMVEIIAKQNNLESKVSPTKGMYNFYQCGLSDYEFILHMMPYAIDETNVAGFRCHVENGMTLIFKPPNLAGAENLGTFGIYGQYPGEPGPTGTERFSVSYRRFLQSKEHHDCVVFRGFETLEHEPATWKANENTVGYGRLARSLPGVINTPSAIITAAEPSLGFKRPGDLKTQAISMWSSNCQSLFRAELKLPIIGDASVGQVATLVAKDPDGDEHFASGTWLIYKIEHARRPKEEYTLLKLERRNWNG